MKKTEHKFKFTAMPINLTACMDNNCRSMLFTLLQLSTFFENREKEENKKWDGWFFRSNADLQAQSRLSEKLVRATISTLFRIGIVDVRLDVKSRNQSPTWFKVNEAAMLKWDKYSIEDCIKNPDYAIKTDPYGKGCKPSYLDKSIIASSVHSQKDSTEREDNLNATTLSKNADNIDNIANGENIDNKLSAGTHERVSTNADSIKSPALAEYKKEEDALMERMLRVTCWNDFDRLTRDVDKLIATSPSPKTTQYTYERLQALTASRIGYFKKKYQSDPDNPIGRHFFRWLDVWEKLHNTSD
jgi:hypothetical protein